MHFDKRLLVVDVVVCGTAKDGPVYAAAWSPSSNEFCVVYGCILLLG